MFQKEQKKEKSFTRAENAERFSRTIKVRIDRGGAETTDAAISEQRRLRRTTKQYAKTSNTKRAIQSKETNAINN